MLLFELYNRPYEWEYDPGGQGSHTARFTTDDGTVYEVIFDELPVREIDEFHKNLPAEGTIWNVMFRRVGEPGEQGTYYPTGSGDQFKVFSTVLDIIKYTTKEYNIDQYAFSAMHPKQTGVFDRFAQLLGKEGYDIIKFTNKMGEPTWAFKSKKRRWGIF